jgi:hypothetical protein
MCITDFYPSRIQKPQQKRGVKNICCHIFCCCKFHKIVNYFISEIPKKKNLGQFSKNYYLELFSQKLSLSSQKCGFGIRDPGSGKNLLRIPDPGVKKAPDPGSGSATLVSKCRKKKRGGVRTMDENYIIYSERELSSVPDPDPAPGHSINKKKTEEKL